MTEWNWAGNLRYSAARLHRPASVEEVQELVADATRRDRRAKAIGSRHSFNRVADTDGDLIDVAALRAIEVDPGAGTAWIGAGSRYADIGPVLHAAGRALPNLPSLPQVTVAGAVATGTHGGGIGNQGLAAAVEAVELVTADGELRTIASGDADFPGAVVALGALGVVTRLRLRTEATYDVAQTVCCDLPIPTAIEHLDEIMGLAHSVSMFTDWHSGSVAQVWLKRRPDRDPPAPPDVFGARPATVPCHPLPGADAATATDQLGRAGPWHERLTHFRPDAVPSAGEELQSEYFVAASDGAAAMEAVVAVSEIFAPLLLVAELRSVGADEQWLSPGSGGPRLGFHFTWRRDQPAVEAVLPVVERALEPFAPRPHWGKVSTVAPDVVRSRFPHVADFAALAARLDPAGTFRNAMTDRLLGSTI